MKISKVIHRFFGLLHKNEYSELYTMTIPIGRRILKKGASKVVYELNTRLGLVVFTTNCQNPLQERRKKRYKLTVFLNGVPKRGENS